MYVMPFGKHKGKPLSSIPRNYLSWLYRQGVYQPLKGEIERVLYGSPCPEKPQAQIIDEAIARTITSLESQLGKGA